MTITIKKGSSKRDVRSAVSRLNKKSARPRLADFYGKMKGKYGDGLVYQKEIRNDWD